MELFKKTSYILVLKFLSSKNKKKPTLKKFLILPEMELSRPKLKKFLYCRRELVRSEKQRIPIFL